MTNAVLYNGQWVQKVHQPDDFFAEDGNIFVKRVLLEKAGDHTYGHSHRYSHMSLLTNGKMLVEVEGEPPTIYAAPAFMHISAEKHHKMTALEDGTMSFCVHDTHGLPIEDLADPFVPAEMRGKHAA
jgi:quercetin dioxygenase-like cupin family protein